MSIFALFVSAGVLFDVSFFPVSVINDRNVITFWRHFRLIVVMFWLYFDYFHSYESVFSKRKEKDSLCVIQKS